VLKAWLTARVSLRLAHLPRTASIIAQRSRRICFMHAAAGLASTLRSQKHLKKQWVKNFGTPRYVVLGSDDCNQLGMGTARINAIHADTPSYNL
jgi:hypothetical protein